MHVILDQCNDVPTKLATNLHEHHTFYNGQWTSGMVCL